MKTILLVEDDQHLADGLTMHLEAEGYQIVSIPDGSHALETFQKGMFDLILLDIMLPGVDGLTICKKLRQEGYTTPILFLTAKDQLDDKVAGLVAGGDDYITKPFSIDELLARIQGIFRRLAWLAVKESEDGEYAFDGRHINFRTYEATGPGGSVQLTRKECMLVKYLVERESEVVSRDQLLDAVWGYNAFPTSRTIDNFIVRLRRIFEDDSNNPVYLQTIRGVGYKFTRHRE